MSHKSDANLFSIWWLLGESKDKPRREVTMLLGPQTDVPRDPWGWKVWCLDWLLRNWILMCMQCFPLGCPLYFYREKQGWLHSRGWKEQLGNNPMWYFPRGSWLAQLWRIWCLSKVCPRWTLCCLDCCSKILSFLPFFLTLFCSPRAYLLYFSSKWV